MSRWRCLDSWRSGNAWYICDRCGQRWRRSRMLTEWTELKVCPICIDPRPPQLTPPDVYPEGLPFPDARPQQDNGDILMDDTTIYPGTMGAGGVFIGGQPNAPSSGQPLGPGAISPLDVDQTPLPSPIGDFTPEDFTIRTGRVFPPSNPGSD
jgi:hypothetical protein